MVSPEKQALELVARLAYNIPGLSGKLKLYFSQFLSLYFSGKLSIDQIQDIENKKASKGYKNQQEIQEAANALSIEYKIWIIASLHMMQSEAERIDDRIASRKIENLIHELTAALDLGGEKEKIHQHSKQLEQSIYEAQNQPVVKIPTAIWPLTLDFVLRWLLLMGFSAYGYDKDYLTVYNTFLIPIFVFVIVYIVSRHHRKANKNLLEAYGGEGKFTIVYGVTTNQYSWLAVYLGTGVFISYLLPDQLHLLTLFGLAFYYFVYLRYLRVGRLTENGLAKQLEHGTRISKNLSVDENDEVIVSLETRLNSSTSRLEAYVLESALFGALSFSGFLQIMATELISFRDLENFASYIYTAAQGFINLDWNTFDASLSDLSSKKSLFCLVSVESLICSIFFLAVIASRLRFSDIADRVRTAINMARAYNEKEESLHEEQEISGKKISRLDALTAKVNEQLHEASLILEEIVPVMTYMEYFRNAGILVFVVILISSSLFITGALGWIFIGMVVATYLYFNRVTLNEWMKAFFLSFRIQFIRWGSWLFLLCIAPYFLAYILKIFLHINAGILFPISTIMTCSYIAIWLMLAAHVDERFGEIEMDLARQKRWRFVKNTVAVIVILYGVAWTFKMLHLMGANEMLMISLMSLAFLMYFVGFYLTKKWWLGIISGWVLAMCFAGFCFKLLHLYGANEMMIAGLTGLLILIPIIIWKRNQYHFLFLRFGIAVLIVSLWFNPLTYQIPFKLEVAYANETLDIDKIVSVIDNNYYESLLAGDDATIDRAISDCDWYLEKYKTTLGYNYVYQAFARNYGGYVLEVMSMSAKDTTLLKRALKIRQQEMKIGNLFDFKMLSTDDIEYFEREADILLALDRKQEAIQSLKQWITYNIPIEVKNALRKRISAMESQQ